MAQLNPVSDMLTILSDSQELQLICLIVAGLKSYGVYSMPELAQQPVLQHSLGENVGLCIHSARCPVQAASCCAQQNPQYCMQSCVSSGISTLSSFVVQGLLYFVPAISGVLNAKPHCMLLRQQFLLHYILFTPV